MTAQGVRSAQSLVNSALRLGFTRTRVRKSSIRSLEFFQKAIDENQQCNQLILINTSPLSPSTSLSLLIFGILPAP
jgi:hypothetical protein